MMDCKKCGFYDHDYGGCTCPSGDRWYACPIENKKPENQKALAELSRAGDDKSEESFDYDDLDFIAPKKSIPCTIHIDNDAYVDAIIKVRVPKWQIGQEASVYFKDTMMIKGVVQDLCSNCCNGNQIEKAKLCQKSYLAGMEHKQQLCEDAISKTEVRKFVEYIQSIKDKHNENQMPINYGTICDIVINGWNLLKLPPVNLQTKMRDATPEERESVNKYVDSISRSTGVNFDTLVQESKEGHWIEERTYMECSNCHDIWHYDENQTERFDFCPTCGWKMESER